MKKLKIIKDNKGWATNSSSYSKAIGKSRLSEFNKESIEFITNGIGVGSNASSIDILHFDLLSINSNDTVPFIIEFDDCDSLLFNVMAVKMTKELSDTFKDNECINFDNEDMERFDWGENNEEIAFEYYEEKWNWSGEKHYPRKFLNSEWCSSKSFTIEDLESCSDKLKLAGDALNNLTVIPYIYNKEKYFILLSSYLTWGSKYSFENGNYRLLIFNDILGMRNSIRVGNEEAIPEYPEMVDIKITNSCKVGCAWCYQDSRDEIDTEEANFEFIKEVVNQLPNYVELAIGGGDVLEISFINDLFQLIDRFSSRNFTINYKSLKRAMNLGDTKALDNFKKYFEFASAIGISVDSSYQLNDTIACLCKLGYSKQDIEKVCFHIIPDIMSFDKIESILYHAAVANCGVLLLGYKVFGRGVKYQEKTNKHEIQLMQDLINKNCNKGYIKVDTKFSTDYELTSINIHEGEFSCNIDAPLKTVSPSSWRNKEQFYEDDKSFKNAFKRIREAQGFKILH